MSTQPNTVVQLPPSYQRSLTEKVILLFCGVAVPLTILGLLVRYAAPSPEPQRITVANPAASPAAVNVPSWNGLTPLVIATVAPRPTSTPLPPPATETPTLLEQLPVCDKAQPGDLCAPIRPEVLPTATAYLVCTDAMYTGSFQVAQPCVKPQPTPEGPFT